MSRYMSRVVRKPFFCICKNNDADQLCSNRQADQRNCFRSTISLLPQSEISSISPSYVTAQPGLFQTWSETLKTGFLTRRFIYKYMYLKIQKVISLYPCNCHHLKQDSLTKIHRLNFAIYISGMVVKTSVISITEGQYIIHKKLKKNKINSNLFVLPLSNNSK